MVPSVFGQSFLGCNEPLCEAHAIPKVYNHFQGLWNMPPPQIIQIVRPVEPEPPKETICCSVCTENIEEECVDFRCRHSFHAKCIDQWFSCLRREGRTLTCPNCRSNITDRDYRKVRALTVPYVEDGDDQVYNPWTEDEDDVRVRRFIEDLENSLGYDSFLEDLESN
jgi:hypothetical protein